jgi:hypothetical protein
MQQNVWSIAISIFLVMYLIACAARIGMAAASVNERYVLFAGGQTANFTIVDTIDIFDVLSPLLLPPPLFSIIPTSLPNYISSIMRQYHTRSWFYERLPIPRADMQVCTTGSLVFFAGKDFLSFSSNFSQLAKGAILA